MAVGAVLVTYGFSLLLFSSQLGVDSLQVSDNDAKTNLEIFSKISLNAGWVYLISGLFFIFGGSIMISFLIVKEKVKEKKVSKFSKSLVLFDEMYDGKEIELEKYGYEAYSVKKIRLKGEPLQYDYSVLKYIEKNKMILITEDSENHGGCIENSLPCIKLGQNPSIDEIVKELEFLKSKN